MREWKKVLRRIITGRHKPVITFLMAVIVFTTTYALILPAITLSRDRQELTCPYVVHQHTDTCYVEEPVYDAEGNQTGTNKVLVCGRADFVAHQHDDSCYQDGKLVCQFPEIKAHVHDKDCYKTEKVLDCWLEETDGHTHTDSCYTETETLTCTKPEHIHTDACYSDVVVSTEQKLVCGYEDGEEISPAVWSEPEYSEAVIDPETGEVLEEAQLIRDAEIIQEAVVHHHDDSCYETIEHTERQLTCGMEEHTHDDFCYRTDRELTCGLEEGEAHRHSASCYTEQQVLTCTDYLELHTHTMDCYEKGPEGESPEEMGWAWYEEDENGNKIVVGDYTHRICGKTELFEHQHDNACFSVNDLSDEDLSAESESETATETEDETVLTDETSETLMETEINAEDDAFEVEVPVEGADYQLKVSGGVECGIPEDAVFKAVAITEDASDYQDFSDMAQEAAADGNEDLSSDDCKTLALFDLSIYDTEGNEIQPVAPLSVQIVLDDETADAAGEAADLYAVHFLGTSLSEDGDVIDAATEEKVSADDVFTEVINAEGTDGAVSFDAGSFSVYAVVYTVDFTYSVDGKEFEFSIPGGGFVSFEQLVEVLGINDTTNDEDAVVSDSTREFVANVENVEFSTPSLVDVSKVDEDTTVGQIKKSRELDVQYSAELTEEQIEEINAQTVEAGDWALISMQPFDSEETITVTMKNGEQFTILVTDAQISKHVITADGKDYIITVTYGNNAQIPEDARLEAEEIEADSDDYKEYVSKALSAIDSTDNQNDTSADLEFTKETVIEFARFFDIRIMSGEEKIEPAAPVKVTVTYVDDIDVNEDQNLVAVHFGENGTEVIEAIEDQDSNSIVFMQDGFSVTGTVVTTNNNWPSSNGKYLMYVESEGSYYAVAHDGSLTPVTISNGKITINISKQIIDSDYLWSYEKRERLGRTNYFIYYNDGTDDIYLDPRETNGLNNSYNIYSMPTLARDNGGLIRYSGNGSPQYIGVNNDSSITGGNQQSDAAPVQFAEMPLTVTVHFVDRKGNPITGVSYSGDNSYPVSENSDGTYSIPYNWEGTTGTVNLENDFSKSGYTYGSTHIAGTRDGVKFTYDGLTIDAALTEKSDNKLYFRSDCGDQYANPRGNLGYKPLPEYNINGSFSVPKKAVNTTTNVGTTNYFRSGEDRDIYVILDPEPSNMSGGGNNTIGVSDPTFNKKLVSNGDGTYTLSLSVTGAAKNTDSNPKANVVFIVDTSSSMRKNSSNPNNNNSPTRLEDTKAAAGEFAEKLLSSNTPGDNDDRIEIAMVMFDGAAVSSEDWYTTYSGSDGFEREINKLVPANMHTGTDWEDALKKAYDLGSRKMADGDATYVVFFTDGEPSQYTNFSGTGEYSGQNRGYRYWYSCFLSRETANDEARAIINSGMTLFSIFAYNPISDTYAATGENGSTLLYNATAYAYNMPPYENEGDNSLEGSRFFHAENTNQLRNAFASILNAINEYIGIQDVKVNDSITSLTSVGITNNDAYTGFRYTRTGGKYGAEEQEWEEAPSATYDENGVHWNLGDALLEDGVTYKVSFVVWPSQEAYDWVADLNNGIRTWTSLEQAGLQDHFLRIEDSSTPSGYRYEVATNPRSKDDDGRILNNLITYKKTHRETIGNLPDGVTPDTPVEETDEITGTKITTTYIKNTDDTYTKIVVTEARDAFGPPDLNMDLSDTGIKVQKKWVADRLEELVAFLFNTSNGELREDKKNIDFVIKQGAAVAPYAESDYKTIKLGFLRYEEVDGQQVPVFDWADEPQNVTVNQGTYSVGTIWEEPLDIAVGLMLTPDKAEERGIDLTDHKYIPVYADENSTEVLYYVLEKGHDYEITEPDLDYRFDFKTDKYHPMLVNKVLRDAKITYKTVGDREIGILESITPEGQRLSALTGENILRGELTIQKDVLNLEGEPDASESAIKKVFPMTVTLTNAKPVFYNGESADEHNVPWIGVQYGNSEHIYYYHRFLEDGTIEYADESVACVNGDYAQGLKNGYVGHAMTESADNKSATETIYLTATDKWVITNVPPGTTYEIRENSVRGYQFVSAEEIGSQPRIIVTDNPLISGTVPPAHVTGVLFTNQKVIVPIDIVVKKTDDAENSTNYLNGAVFKLTYRADSSETFSNVSKEEVPQLDAESKFVVPVAGIKLSGLKDGQYQLQEISPPTGYVINNSYPVTFTVSEGTIVNTNGTISGVRYSAATETSDAEFIIPNTPGAALPNTGGPGTHLLYLLGITLIGLAGTGFMMKRRKKAA